jgi:hypothetical protein
MIIVKSKDSKCKLNRLSINSSRTHFRATWIVTKIARSLGRSRS